MDKDIAELDLDAIAYKVCRDEGFSLREVDEAVVGYRAFLQIIRDAEPGFSAAPTRAIDIVWHHHILDTLKYHHDCNLLFGKYIHHFPYSGIFEGEDILLQEQRREDTNKRLSRIITD